MKAKDLLAEIAELPVAMRARLADEILRTLNPADPEIEAAWIEEVDRRIKEYESGQATMVPGEEVFKKMDEIVNK